MASWWCPNCQRHVSGRDVFCSSCGLAWWKGGNATAYNAGMSNTPPWKHSGTENASWQEVSWQDSAWRQTSPRRKSPRRRRPKASDRVAGGEAGQATAAPSARALPQPPVQRAALDQILQAMGGAAAAASGSSGAAWQEGYGGRGQDFTQVGYDTGSMQKGTAEAADGKGQLCPVVGHLCGTGGFHHPAASRETCRDYAIFCFQGSSEISDGDSKGAQKQGQGRSGLCRRLFGGRRGWQRCDGCGPSHHGDKCGEAGAQTTGAIACLAGSVAGCPAARRRASGRFLEGENAEAVKGSVGSGDDYRVAPSGSLMRSRPGSMRRETPAMHSIMLEWDYVSPAAAEWYALQLSVELIFNDLIDYARDTLDVDIPIVFAKDPWEKEWSDPSFRALRPKKGSMIDVKACLAATDGRQHAKDHGTEGRDESSAFLEPVQCEAFSQDGPLTVSRSSGKL